MKFKKGDKVRHEEKGSEWLVQGAIPGARVYCRRYITKKDENKTLCFPQEDIEFVSR